MSLGHMYQVLFSHLSSLWTCTAATTRPHSSAGRPSFFTWWSLSWTWQPSRILPGLQLLIGPSILTTCLIQTGWIISKLHPLWTVNLEMSQWVDTTEAVKDVAISLAAVQNQHIQYINQFWHTLLFSTLVTFVTWCIKFFVSSVPQPQPPLNSTHITILKVSVTFDLKHSTTNFFLLNELLKKKSITCETLLH